MAKVKLKVEFAFVPFASLFPMQQAPNGRERGQRGRWRERERVNASTQSSKERMSIPLALRDIAKKGPLAATAPKCSDQVAQSDSWTVSNRT